ncbi:MAG: DUF5009 domain-containing protein, partial [Pirellulaceae bacterium]|nr:DUF5009 domain-containing protein [Pirellulaceae bacterium]
TASRHLETQPDSNFWKQLKYQFSHVEWQGCAFWDLIQPSFMFMVGVSMAYSYVKRQSRGDSWVGMFGHAMVRSVVLVLLGVFLSSTSGPHTNWAFMNVLSQIGLGYPFLFLMWGRHVALQWLVVALLLVGTGLAYTNFSGAGIDVETGNQAVGISAEWAQEHLNNVPPAWHKNANIGQAVDVQVLNLFPREKPFEFNAGGYQTFNFIPALATMLLGLICGELLRSSWTGGRKVLALFVLGGVLIGLGLLGANYGWPIIKRIWSPSWALYSTGICCMILGGLFGIIDVAGWRAWSMFLVVVGMNSIAIYMMGQLLRSWTKRQLDIHIGSWIFDVLGPNYQPMLSATAVGMVFWLTCYWMMRQRIFIRV